MEKIKVNARKDTPYVLFDVEIGVLEIAGKSLPEDANKFYAPIIAAIEQYIKSPQETTTLNFRFLYINTASSKKVIEILNLFIKNKSPKNKLVINWFYKRDDEDQFEEGEDYSDMVNFPFNFIEYVRFV